MVGKDAGFLALARRRTILPFERGNARFQALKRLPSRLIHQNHPDSSPVFSRALLRADRL